MIQIQIRMHNGTGLATVRFARYDAQAVAIIKSTPLHRWDKERKTWTVDMESVPLLAQTFETAGFLVAVDGVPWAERSTPKAETFASPLVALFGVLPSHMRKPTYRALSKVFHPDAGGDTKLMQQLNDALERSG
jgi:hypothetical protein